MIKKAGIFAVLFVVLNLWTGNLRAELITIHLTAEVIYVDDLAGLLEGKVNVGDIITGSYSYDSDTPDSSPSSSLGTYWHYTPPYGINLSIGGFVFQTDPDNVNFLLQVDDGYIGGDGYLIRSYNNLPLTNWVEVDHISWQLNDYSGTALSSDALPITPPVLTDWPDTGYHLTIDLDNGGSSYIRAEVTSAVPESATVLLLAFGSLLLTRRRR